MEDLVEGLAVAPGHDDILGQQAACAGLWRALESGRLHHCYLFEGPGGVGKATVALRLAMAANCEATEGPRPCTRCESCRLIARGRHPDVIHVGSDPERKTEIISVRQARDLLRRLMLHRHSARRRFAIIEPVDIMGTEATNALLKAFEEPPPDTGFILVTARARSLLPTVISRSLRVRFRTVPPDQTRAWLRRRGVEQVNRVAGLSLGSPGRALQLAEGRLADLDRVRQELLAAISRGPIELFEYTAAFTKGRASWYPKKELLLENLENLLRDAITLGAGSGAPLLDPGLEPLSRRWGEALWPTGLRRVEDALREARIRFDLNVSARQVLDALLSCLAAELGEARKVPDPLANRPEASEDS